ncbi:MAG TPA: cytochrome c peroxidase [Kofleriaceae bacterium]|nr:cytochrome c peroxidase [Kofleriaceae bacterium]
MKKMILLIVLAGCPAKSSGTHAKDDHGSSASNAPLTDDAMPPAPGDAGAPNVTLGPAPAAPAVPFGLPATDGTPALHPEAIALGELLFFEPRISASGTTSCATCHDPDHGWSDLRPRANVDGGQPNLRRTPAIANLLWQVTRGGFGWDGRYGTLVDLVASHWKGQLGMAPADAIAKVASVPLYGAHLERQPGAQPAEAAAENALAEFVLSRYQGNAPWDRYEHGDHAAVSADAAKGYALFTGKAQCSVCHVPPLYTDGGYHAIGLIKLPDEGRGRVDAAAKGAFKTPTLRGATAHAPYFHDGSATTLEAAIDWHLAGGTGQGADRSIIDPALAPIVLAPDERLQLIAFVRTLSAPSPAPYKRPELPQ